MNLLMSFLAFDRRDTFKDCILQIDAGRGTRAPSIP
jgi:hypothetical protein